MANYNYVNWAIKPNAKVSEQLARALKPFVDSYERDRDPVGDSDLYNEQPRSVSVTLGDCRRAASVMRLLQENNK